MQKKIASFFEGLFNVLIYIPHIFSVLTLLRTLFAPWKNIVDTNKLIGFSLSEWASHVFFGIISRTIGFFMRVTVLIAFVVTEVVYVVLMPLIIIMFFILLPFLALIDSIQPSLEERKDKYKKLFVARHSLTKESAPAVEAWFESEFAKVLKQSQWWKLPNLMSQTPIARDWAMGYTPYLDKYAENLSSAAYVYSFRETYGREKEVRVLETLLSRSEEANAILVGEEGVGKDAIVYAFARRVYEGRTNSLLNYKRVLRLDMERIANEFTDLKQRETFFEDLLLEAFNARNVIIFIEDIERYIYSGGGNIDLSVPMEKYAKTSQLQIVATATPYQYEKYVFRHEKLSSVFTKIDIDEMSADDTVQVLLPLALTYEHRYDIVIPYETITAVVRQSDFYISTSPFPEKSIQLLDTACSFAAESKLKTLTPPFIDEVISQKTHAPTRIDEKTKKTLVNFESILAKRVVGQDNALHQLSAAVRRSFMLLGKRKKPIGSFLFLGPTGTGKTETAKALAEAFFGGERQLIRFDMSLYQNKADIARLIGESRANDPGLLTTAVRKNPYGVLLLDELEKAHRDLLNIFLTVLDEGYFTDGAGKRVDCKNLIIVATSNAGAQYIYESRGAQVADEQLIEHLIKTGVFSPEFLNRFDGVVCYLPLTEPVLLKIARKFADKISANYLSTQKVRLQISDATLQALAKKSFHPEYGARNMERIIAQEIEDIVAQKILGGSLKAGQTINM